MKKFTLIIVLLVFSFGKINAQVNWKSISTRGMGYVDGIIVHPQTNIKYVRTDVGGVFKLNQITNNWENLTDKLISINQNDMVCVETFAVDGNSSGANQVLYALSGNGNKSFMLKSVNDGVSWSINQGWNGDSIKVYGNGDWRCAGERLAIDPVNSNVVFCGTRFNGLWKTIDAAQQWNKINSFTAIGGNGGLPLNGGISFVVFDSSSTISIANQIVSKNIYVGLIDGGVYRSENGGNSWNYLSNGFDTATYNPVRAVFEGGKLIVALMQDGDQYNDGEIWEYNPANNLSSGNWQNKTPGLQNGYICPVWGKYQFNAVKVRPGFPNTVYAAIRGATPRKIFFTTNFNAVFPDWKILTMDDSSGYSSCISNYQRSVFSFPKSWVNTSGYDWVGDIAFDAADNKKLWISSGNGVMKVEDITANPAIINSNTTMESLEILCVNEIAAPPFPNTTPLITASMDVLGIVYQDINNGNIRKLDTTFGLGAGISLAYSFQNPNTMALIGQDYFDPININRKIRSTDGGNTWQSFFTTVPNCNDAPWGGNITISATNANNMIWVPYSESKVVGCAQKVKNFPRYTFDGGQTWSFCNQINFTNGSFPMLQNGTFSTSKSLESDKVNGNKFYYYAMPGYTFATQLWRTVDGGANWTKMSDGVMPITGSGQLKANPFIEDDIWFAPFNSYILDNDTNPDLRKLWHSTDGGSNWATLNTVDEVYAFGFGMKANASNYSSLIVYGKINNVESIFISFDLGLTFNDLGTNNLPEGIISNLEGDMKIPKRFYASTGCRGAFYADVNSIITTSLPNLNNAVFNFSLSPNPAKSQLLITINDTQNLHELLILDVLGKEMKKIKLNTLAENIDISFLKTGVYFVQIINKGERFIEKLVIE